MSKRIYKNLGQITTVEYIRGWKNIIIDCGYFWMKHDVINDLYKKGTYDEEGYFISLEWISREEFIRHCKFIFRNLKRIK